MPFVGGSLIAGNSFGWWGLIGIPVILAIHLFQARRTRYTIATLFLVHGEADEHHGGKVLTRLLNSWTLWLQILAALLVTALLLDPRIMREDSHTRAVVVLDSSFSMQACLEKLGSRVFPMLRTLAGAAASTEWIVLDSSPQSAKIYSGSDFGALQTKIARWVPDSPHHDPRTALAAARELVPSDQPVLFVTDRPIEVDAGITVLAIGGPIANVGFAGVSIASNARTWKAFIRNYGTTPQARSWSVNRSGVRSTSEAITLEPGTLKTVQGNFGNQRGERLVLELDSDLFTLDDTLPLVPPVPKRLRVFLDVEPGIEKELALLFDSLEQIEIADSTKSADAAVATCRGVDCRAPGELPTIFLSEFKGSSGANQRLVTGAAGNSDSSLTESLSWKGLRFPQNTRPVQTGATVREVLVWSGPSPLISHVQLGQSDSLFVHFPPERSNFFALPAGVILVHRFFEHLRADLVAPIIENYELGQQLFLPSSIRAAVELVPEGAPTIISPPALAKAPRAPVFFSLLVGGKKLLDGASHFADSREADFLAAVTAGEVSALRTELTVRNSDSLLPLVIVSLLLVSTLFVLWSIS